MCHRKEVSLQNFFIFNSSLGPKEGEELKKILYYYPLTDSADVQIKNVGLVEGIIQFTKTFKASTIVNSLHTNKTRQLYFQPEKDFWIVITLNLPTTIKDDTSQVEYLDKDIEDNVYGALLEQSYYMYRLFYGTFKQSDEDILILKSKLEHFFKSYLKSLKLSNADILNIFNGIQYLPLDKLTFLKVQCLINYLECNYPEIEYSSFLYNDHLIWSGVEPNDMKIIYQYLIETLLPSNTENELQGNSTPRNCSSPFNTLHNGRFITGPSNLKTAKNIGKIPKIYLYIDGKPFVYYLVVYRTLSASICLFIRGDYEVNLNFFIKLDEFINPKLTSLVNEITEYCTKQIVTPSTNLVETTPRFIYFNKLNMAYKSSVHLDNKQNGNIACPKTFLKIMAELNNKKSILGQSGQIIVKTMNDYCVVLKVSNSREFYIALQQKNLSLTDVCEEVKKLCETELKGIFFHPFQFKFKKN